jgi:hypothetical protein
MAHLRMGQGIGHHGFDSFAALGTPVAVNRVLGDDRVDVLGNVKGDARPRLLARRHLALADGTTFQAQHDPLMNDRRRRPPTALVPLLPAGLLAAPRRSVFVINRLHPRRRGRRVSRLALLLGQHLGHLQQGKHDRFGPLLVNGLGFLGGELRPQSNVQSRNGSGLLATRDGKTYPKTRIQQRSAAYG